MTHVLVLDSTNEDIFFCGFCKQVYNSLSLFLTHKNTECRKELMPQVTPTSREPENNVNERKELICDHCHKTFNNMKTLQVHIRMHNQKPYQCLICGRCFIQNSHLQRHVMSHRVWPDSLSETTAKSTDVELSSYTCLYCDTILSNYNQFRAHLKNHISLKKFKCIQIQCNKFYDTVESLMHHVSNTHKSLSFTCHNCNQTFDTLNDIALHYQSFNNMCIQESTRTELFKCSQCDAVFRRPEKLSLHMLTENHKKTCIHCNKTFSSDKRLRLHLQIHRKLKPYQCNICSQSFHMKKYLSSHMLKHGEKQFVCSVCKCNFKRKDSLKRHVKSHQLRKLHKCPFRETLDCQKEFTRSDKLKSHLKSHTKRMNMDCKDQKIIQQPDPGTIEICIVPLDNRNKE